MPEGYLGEIKIVSFDFAPKGWAFCNGQLLPINQNQALFALLGTTYGGNGQTTFALPDMRDRIPIHVGNGHVLGEKGGEISHTLSMSEMPQHIHAVMGSSSQANTRNPQGGTWGVNPSGLRLYANPSSPSHPLAAMSPAAVTSVGGSQPHQNMPPYLALRFIINLQGIFPSRN